MRYSAQRTLALQDNLPADGNIYMLDIMDKGGSMIKALRDWEKRRGIVFSFKGKMLGTKKKEEEVQKKPKQKAKVPAKPADTIRVPRDKDRPKSEVSAERRRKLNEYNRKYRERNREKCIAATKRSKERAKAMRAV